MISKIDSLSEFVDTKINNWNNQQKILETLWENIEFLQMELQIKNNIINSSLETQSVVVESLLHLKDQNNQLKQQKWQQGTDQPNKVSNQQQHNQYQNNQQNNHQHKH